MRPLSRAQDLALAACLLAPLQSHAGRPLVSDDASILGPGQCTVETWFDHHPDGHQYWAVPHCGVDNWELQGGLGELWPNQPDRPSPSLLIEGKTVFRRLVPNGWAYGLVLADQIVKGTGATANLLVNLPLSFSLLDDAVRVHFNAGWTHQRGVRNGLTWTAGAEWTVNKQFGLTLEAYGNGPPAVQAGVRYAVLSGKVVLDAAFGDRLSLNGSARYYQLGMTITLPTAR